MYTPIKGFHIMAKFDHTPGMVKGPHNTGASYLRGCRGEGIFGALSLYEHSLTHGSKILFWTYGSQYAP